MMKITTKAVALMFATSSFLSGCGGEPEVTYSYTCNDGTVVTGDSYKVHTECGPHGGTDQMTPDGQLAPDIGGSDPSAAAEAKEDWRKHTEDVRKADKEMKEMWNTKPSR